MNIYRLTILAAANLPAGAIVDAVVAAPTPDLARGLVSLEEQDRDLARGWLFSNDAMVTEVGPASQSYLDDLLDGDVPHSLVIERKA